MRTAFTRCWPLVLLAATAARGQEPSGARDRFFAEGPVVKLALEVGPKEMDALRKDPRSYVRAKLVEDGATVYEGVGVHLRGSAGSFRNLDDKPGFTLNMDKYADGQRFHGMDKFHLANSAQDPTYTQELICSDLFRAAGVPAARVGHAVVTLNGRKLGLFYLKEGYDKGFLKRHFGRADGNFYDGGFLRDIDQPLEQQSGSGDVPDRADLDALYDASQLGDRDRRYRRLEKLLDLDRFLAYLALEAVTSDWDGYAMNRNNYRVYHDPAKNKITFIPSGMDQMFSDPNGPAVPGFNGAVARGLLDTPQGKDRYLAKLAEVMKTAYKPDALVKRLDDVQAKIQPALAEVDKGAAKDLPNHFNRLRDAIPRRAKSIDEQLTRLAAEKAAKEKERRERREREQREREAKEREAKEKERKEKEAKEREAKEKARKEQEAKEQKEREQKAKEARDKEAKEKADREKDQEKDTGD